MYIMKVQIIEKNQQDNEGTLYNVLDIMYVYVMFDGHTRCKFQYDNAKQ